MSTQDSIRPLDSHRHIITELSCLVEHTQKKHILVSSFRCSFCILASISPCCSRSNIHRAAVRSFRQSNKYSWIVHSYYWNHTKATSIGNRFISSCSSDLDQSMATKSHGQESVGELENYKFPESKIKRSADTGKQPIVLVACGSFSPVTKIPAYTSLYLNSCLPGYLFASTYV